MTTPTTGPLSEADLRRIAAHYVIEAVSEWADDASGLLDVLEDTAAKLGIPMSERGLDSDEAIAIAKRLSQLLNTATVFVDWPEATA
jgi:hypothetical protein